MYQTSFTAFKSLGVSNDAFSTKRSLGNATRPAASTTRAASGANSRLRTADDTLHNETLSIENLQAIQGYLIDFGFMDPPFECSPEVFQRVMEWRDTPTAYVGVMCPSCARVRVQKVRHDATSKDT